MTGAKLLPLDDVLDVGFDLGPHTIGLVSYDDDRARDAGRLHGLDHMLQHGTARHRMEDFRQPGAHAGSQDRKSTRLNSSHVKLPDAAFCWKKKCRSCKDQTVASGGRTL